MQDLLPFGRRRRRCCPRPDESRRRLCLACRSGTGTMAGSLPPRGTIGFSPLEAVPVSRANRIPRMGGRRRRLSRSRTARCRPRHACPCGGRNDDGDTSHGRRIRVVATLHKLFRSKRWRRRISGFYPYADVLVGISPDLSEGALRITGIPAERIHTVYNPIVSPDVLRKAEAPSGHPWLDESDRPVILAAGRLVEEKASAPCCPPSPCS